MSYIIFYILPNIFTLQRTILECIEFPETKISQNIYLKIAEIYNKYVLCSNNTPIIFDSGANILAATLDKLRIKCGCPYIKYNRLDNYFKNMRNQYRFSNSLFILYRDGLICA